MIEILPMQPDQVAAAKMVVYQVAHHIFEPEKPFEEFVAGVDHEHELADMDDYRRIYNENRGLFLVALDDGRLIGTAGVRRLSEQVAELKRIWLLEDYHGQKIGYRMVTMLLDFAREHGYTTVQLGTTVYQKRAQVFYKRMGFYQIPNVIEDPDEITMEMML